MILLAWRQFRLQAAVAIGLLALVGVVVLISGSHLDHLYNTTVLRCAIKHDCTSASSAFLKSDRFLQAALPPVLLVAPALIGVFWGAPLVAREIESGTFRLVWTQSVSRMRWLATRLAVAGLVSMAVTGLLSFMVSSWFSPIDRINVNRFSPAMFGVRGITPIGYAAFGFALGVTLGVLVRRTIPAMAATVAGFIGARLAVTYWVRPYLSSPLKIVVPLTMPGNEPASRVVGIAPPPGSWVLSDETLEGARVVGQSGGFGPNGVIGLQVSPRGTVSIPGAGKCPGAHLNAGPGSRPSQNSKTVRDIFDACARHLRLHTVLTYQPASRYWPFQWYETAIFLALALILAGLCFWWLVGREHRLARRAGAVSGTALRESPGGTVEAHTFTAGRLQAVHASPTNQPTSAPIVRGDFGAARHEGGARL